MLWSISHISPSLKNNPQGICLSVIGQETHPHGYQVVKVMLGLFPSMFLASHP
jgi:hypothetical protein